MSRKVYLTQGWTLQTYTQRISLKTLIKISRLVPVWRKKAQHETDDTGGTGNQKNETNTNVKLACYATITSVDDRNTSTVLMVCSPLQSDILVTCRKTWVDDVICYSGDSNTSTVSCMYRHWCVFGVCRTSTERIMQVQTLYGSCLGDIGSLNEMCSLSLYLSLNILVPCFGVSSKLIWPNLI